jgi:primosomal protein N' (replication factor Y) (superfamily II helicase)
MTRATASPLAIHSVGVLLPLPLSGAYDYRVPEGMALAPGDYVSVPLGGREATGVVWGPAAGVAEARLKTVLARLPAPPMAEAHRRFVEWVARYTLSSPGAVLRMAMSVPDALLPPRAAEGWRVVEGYAPPAKLTAARRRALDVLAREGPMTTAGLAAAAEVSDAVIRGLAAAGALARAPLPAVEPDPPEPDPEAGPVALSPEQAAAAAALVARVAAGGYSVTLLEGVTGSGKTEVYFQAVAAALAQGRQVLVLLPEIALSAQWLERFRRRFGAAPTLWHSDVRGLERRRAWRAVARGRARVVVGARSALFLPFADLGLVVVDEEHDTSFKQEDGVVYHARDMAVVRARLGGIPAVLASATPALETRANVEAGRYARVHLAHRHGGAAMPAVELVDMRRTPPPPRRWLSPPLEAELGAVFARGEQAMLFLNRRGYAPLVLCRACGHRFECPNCQAWLVEHRLAGRFACHHCGHAAPPPPACPSCAAPGPFAACGPGIERVAEEAAALFPDKRLALMASDTVHGPEAAAALVAAMHAGEIDLLIGTQIVAKGHHFPTLTLVGVVDADLGLAGGDPRAGERTWQLLAQVAGRAGRAERPGRVLLQTYMPEHAVMRALASGDEARFVAEEMSARRRMGLPPFGRLAALIVSGTKAERVAAAARDLARAAPAGPGIEVLGPAPAPLAVLRGLHRQRLLVKATKEAPLQPALREWLARAKAPPGVRIKVDIDPYSFL